MIESVKALPVFFYQESSGNEPARKWLRELSAEDRKIIGAEYEKCKLIGQ